MSCSRRYWAANRGDAFGGEDDFAALIESVLNESDGLETPSAEGDAGEESGPEESAGRRSRPKAAERGRRMNKPPKRMNSRGGDRRRAAKPISGPLTSLRWDGERPGWGTLKETTVLVSMTGFGEATERVGLDRRRRRSPVSINNRHLKISYRAGDGYHGLEPKVESLVRDAVHRGTVQVNVRVERKAAAADYRLNTEVLLGYQEQLTQLAGVDAMPSVAQLLCLPGVIITPSASEADPEADWPSIEKAVRSALVALAEMRRREGAALADDLLEHCGIVAEQLAGVEERSPLVAEDYRKRLQERVGQSLEKLGVSIDESDLVREVALFVDRSDISEETVRLRSHLDQFDTTVRQAAAPSGRQEGAGRKLEFIVQEMGREVNTIGSKANDTEISTRVVEMKTALERIREQVQNIE